VNESAMRNRMFATAPAIVAALAGFAMLALVLKRGVDLPFWDEWEWTQMIYDAHRHTLTFAELWAPHAEHRMFVPNLVVLGLDRFGGWDTVREQVVSVALVVLTQLLLWLTIARTVVERLRGIVFLAATALLFGLIQYENFDWGFQTAWFLCDFGMVLTVWALALPDSHARNVGIAIFGAMVASLSVAQGVTVWVAGLVVLLVLPKRSLRIVLIWLAAAVVGAVLARYGVPSASAAVARDPMHLLEYALAYLGAPIAASFGQAYGVCAGIALIIWLGSVATLMWRRAGALRTLAAPWFGLVAYTFVCATLTAAGRGMNDLSQAASSRYTSIATFAWIAAIVLTVICLHASRIRKAFWVTPIAAVLCLSVAQDSFGNARWIEHTAQMRVARERLSRGDVEAIASVYPYPERFLMLVGELYAIHDGVFTLR